MAVQYIHSKKVLHRWVLELFITLAFYVNVIVMRKIEVLPVTIQTEQCSGPSDSKCCNFRPICMERVFFCLYAQQLLEMLFDCHHKFCNTDWVQSDATYTVSSLFLCEIISLLWLCVVHLVWSGLAPLGCIVVHFFVLLVFDKVCWSAVSRSWSALISKSTVCLLAGSFPVFVLK